MLKFVKFGVSTLMLLQCLQCLVAANELVNLNKNLTLLKNDLWTKNVTLVDRHKLTENPLAVEKKVLQKTEIKVAPQPLNKADTALKSANRSGRQLFYSPQFYFIQNYGAEDSKCITSRGLVGVCMSFNSCLLNRRQKVQPSLPFSRQQWPTQLHFLPYFQQQQEFCTFYDQFAGLSYGICCTDTPNVTPVQTPPAESPAEEGNKQEQEISNKPNLPKPENNEDSEVLEADLSSYQPKPPMYDNADNAIDYDPIENLKQTAWFNNNNNYIRYPWPQQQFVGFSGVQQWPPPLPTHPPAIASWPPQVPTHPPNHHYPTHPPLNGVTSSSTRRPAYPNYPTRRTTTTSTTTATTTTTTQNPDFGSSSSLGLPLQCGVKNVENPDQERIVGGTNASPNEFPWITVLFKSGKQFCGGSLITSKHILTAAHCVARMTSWDVASLTAHLGDYNIRTDFEVRHISRRIKRLVRHKGFDFSTLHNDIAILTLNEPVEYTKEIQPICLPTSTAQQSRSYSGHIGIVAGWGSLRENGPQPSILQKVQIPIWTNTECAQKYGRAAPAGIISSMICAGQEAKDSCSGDSGGPMIVNDGARYVQVGIVSWGIGCGKGQYPGVYTRVTSLLPWIYKNIK